MSRWPRIAGWSVSPRTQRQESSSSHAAVSGSPTRCSNSCAVVRRSLTRSRSTPRSAAGSPRDNSSVSIASINSMISISSTPRFCWTTPSPLDGSEATWMCGRHRWGSYYSPLGAGAVSRGSTAFGSPYSAPGTPCTTICSRDTDECYSPLSKFRRCRRCHPPSLFVASGRQPMHLIPSVRPDFHRHKPPRVVPDGHFGARLQTPRMVILGAWQMT